MFVLCLVEKYRGYMKYPVGLMDSEKAYDKVCREELRKIFYEYRIEEFVVMGMKSLYDM